MEPFTLEPPPEKITREDRRRALERRAREISGEGELFNEASWQLVLELIEDGYTVEEINANDDLPSWSTIRRWIKSDPARIEQYRVAREMSADILESQMLDIARYTQEKDDVPAANLKIRTIQYVISKRAPKTYGDKAQMDTGPAPEREKIVVKGGLPEMPE